MSRIGVASVVFLFLSSLTLQGCGSSSEILAQTKQCTVDADCSGGGWCLDGVCQTPYGLTLAIDKAPSADGKIHVGDKLNLSVTVTGGTPPVEIALVDEKRLQLVAAPYAFQWDVKTADVTEGSHRVIATAKGGTRTYSSQSIEVIVDRVAPNPPVVNAVASPTNAASIVLTGTAEEKATLTVYDGATSVAQLQVPAGGGWSTLPVNLPAEGTYTLTATATDLAGNQSAPATATFVVDRTAPTVVGRTPAPGATNVWSRDPITATFSEAMSVASAGDASVLLSGRGGASISKSLPFSQGDTVMKIVPGSLADVPNELTVSLTSALTDRAGNALVAATPWSWVLPAWQEPADPVFVVGNSSSYYLAIDRAGSPTIGITAYGSVPVNVLLRWDGSTYVAMELPAMSPPAYIVGLDVDPDGKPVLAWTESIAERHLHAARWDGAAWVGGATPLATGYYGGTLPLRFETSGANRRPVVAWHDGTLVHAMRLEGSAWQDLGGAMTPGGTSVQSVLLSFDGTGTPRVGWLETRSGSPSRTYAVARTLDGAGGTWTSKEWELPATMAGGLSPSRVQNDGSVQFDPSGRPVIAWLDASTPRKIYVSRISARNESWEILGTAALNVDPTRVVYQAGCQATALGMDASGAPVLVWIENGTSLDAMFAKRWRDPVWEPMGESVNSQGNLWAPCGPRVAVSGEGIVAVSWWESYLGVKAKRYNR